MNHYRSWPLKEVQAKGICSVFTTVKRFVVLWYLILTATPQAV